MKQLMHALLAGTLLSLPPFVLAEPPQPQNHRPGGTAENTYVKVANGVYMDVRLMQDSVKPRSPPSGRHVRDNEIMRAPGRGNDADQTAYRNALLQCGPLL